MNMILIVAIPRRWDTDGYRNVNVWPGRTPDDIVSELGFAGRNLVRCVHSGNRVEIELLITNADLMRCYPGQRIRLV